MRIKVKSETELHFTVDELKLNSFTPEMPVKWLCSQWFMVVVEATLDEYSIIIELHRNMEVNSGAHYECVF